MSIKPQKRRSAERLDLLDGLFQLSFLLQGTLARIAATRDLSTVQARLLGILRDREPRVLELARYLGLKKSSMSELIDRAEQRGLVERIRSESDRRAARVRLTARGRVLTRAVEAEVWVAMQTLVGVLPGGDQERLRELLQRVVAGGAGSLVASGRVAAHRDR
jgi:MarR family transcriptional regulator, lower aerobic nicotinate degradation pathway regulator